MLFRKSVLFTCFAVILTVMSFSAAQGLTYPLLSLMLAANHASATEIALSAACTPLGIIISAPMIGRYLANYDRKKSLCLAIVFVACILWALIKTPPGTLWFPLRIFLGCGVNTIYVLSEMTLLQIAPASSRARLIAAYTAITNLGYALGPVLLLLLGNDYYKSIYVLTLILFVSMLPVLISPLEHHVKNHQGSEEGSVSVLKFIQATWILVLCFASTTLFDNAFMSLLPVYGLSQGLDTDQISLFLTLILAGGILVQLPIGWLLDKLNKLYVTLMVSLVGTLCFVFFRPEPVIESFSFVLPLALGACVFSLQTIALNELGLRYSGKTLAAGNAAFAMMWGLSGVFGVPATGFLMEYLGPVSLFWTTGSLFVTGTFLFLFWMKRTPIPKHT